VFDFERWYGEEFEGPAIGEMSSTLLTYQGNGGAGAMATDGGDMGDEEAEAYLRAKRNVDTLHKAKKLEKMRPGGYKQK
jgi:hypothetical protein